MQDKLTLMIPGPTPVPETVLMAMGRHPIGHRSADFQKIVKRTTEQLKWLHQTSSDVLVLAGSGTAAMEAGIINVLSKGDKVLCGDNGKFGERWVKVAKAYDLDVQVVKAEWGQPLDPEAFRTALEADSAKAIKAVILTHSETSTGVINDLETIAKHVLAHGSALTIADCVTSLGACDVPMDKWGLDVVGSGSQKGYMMPPGLAFVAMSEKAWAAHAHSDLPKFYLDLGKYRKAAADNSNPFTPPINLYFALEAALEMMQEEGLEAGYPSRHESHGHAPLRRRRPRQPCDHRRGTGRHRRREPAQKGERALRHPAGRGTRPPQGQGVPHRPPGLCLRPRCAHRRGRHRSHGAGAGPGQNSHRQWRCRSRR
jgi:aspartate aminotransferase-like enzyme